MDASVRAKALARLLALGFAEPRDIVAWVDSLIVEAQVPNEFLIDAALSETKRGELITALGRFGATARTGDASEVWSAIFGGLHAWLLKHPEDGPRIAHTLYEMAVAGEYPDSDAEGEMYMLDDQYELAVNGVYGARDEVDANLRTFLARYAA